MKKVISFTRANCKPCKIYGPIFDQIAENLKDQAEFYKIEADADFAGPLIREYGIVMIPTTVFLSEDGTFHTEPGILTEERIKSLI